MLQSTSISLQYQLTYFPRSRLLKTPPDEILRDEEPFLYREHEG